MARGYACAHCGAMRRLLRRKVLFRPATDLLERRKEGPARLGEAVSDRKGWTFRDGSRDESLLAQLAETLREHGVADPVDGPGESSEPRRPAAQGPQNHAGPPLAEEVEGSDQRGVGPLALPG